MTGSLYFEVDGLSFAARAGLSAITAYTYEYQDEEILVRVIKHTLALSDEAWASIYEELYAAGHVYSPLIEGSGPTVALCRVHEILCHAIGCAGRPSAKDWADLKAEALKAHGNACIYCGASEEPLALDHVVAVAAGGSNHRLNLVPACRSCNSAKGSKSWAEWYPLMVERRR